MDAASETSRVLWFVVCGGGRNKSNKVKKVRCGRMTCTHPPLGYAAAPSPIPPPRGVGVWARRRRQPVETRKEGGVWQVRRW